MAVAVATVEVRDALGALGARPYGRSRMTASVVAMLDRSHRYALRTAPSWQSSWNVCRARDL